MEKFILGKKGRMSQFFTPAGKCIPVTLIEAGPCFVTKVCTMASDGYDSVQLGFDQCRDKVVSKAEVGHCKKAGTPTLRHLREIRLAQPADAQIGAKVTCDIFAPGDCVNVIGHSKGRGFAGVHKRYQFSRQPAGHGGMATRRRGSSGSGTDPGRVFKGKRMAGHYGTERFTILNLEVVAVDLEANMLAIRGAVPGYRGSLIEVRPVNAGYPTQSKAAKA